MGSSPTKHARPGSNAQESGDGDADGCRTAAVHAVAGSREERVADGDGRVLDHAQHDLLVATHAKLLTAGHDRVCALAFSRAQEMLDDAGKSILAGMSERARTCMFSTLVSETMIVEHSAKSVAEVRRIAEVHVGKQLRAEHFDGVLAALIATCAEVLREDWTPEVAEAYRHAFVSLSNIMKTAMTDADPNEFAHEHCETVKPVKRRRSRVSFCSHDGPPAIGAKESDVH